METATKYRRRDFKPGEYLAVATKQNLPVRVLVTRGRFTLDAEGYRIDVEPNTYEVKVRR